MSAIIAFHDENSYTSSPEPLSRSDKRVWPARLIQHDKKKRREIPPEGDGVLIFDEVKTSLELSQPKNSWPGYDS